MRSSTMRSSSAGASAVPRRPAWHRRRRRRPPPPPRRPARPPRARRCPRACRRPPAAPARSPIRGLPDARACAGATWTHSMQAAAGAPRCRSALAAALGTAAGRPPCVRAFSGRAPQQAQRMPCLCTSSKARRASSSLTRWFGAMLAAPGTQSHIHIVPALQRHASLRSAAVHLEGANHGTTRVGPLSARIHAA